MKKYLNSMLTAAIVVALGFGMGSCTGNTDNSTTPSDNPQQQEAERQATAQKFWAVVSQLVDVDDYTVDYEDKTFEPVYGVLQGTATDTRYVYTNSPAVAAERFADLIEADGIDENTQSYVFDDPAVGRLVYTKGSGRTLATVDVDIKQIPSLKRIVFMPGVYANARFQGRAYYRFGDVVSREVQGYDGENVTEYWICVRPAFGPESKGDSHWVCANVLPKKNVWHLEASNGNSYYLPTGIGTYKEHMQNFAEMLYAIYLPDLWEQHIEESIENGTRLRIFQDFTTGNINLHNRNFWLNVQSGWSDKNILQRALNYSQGVMFFENLLQHGSLNLLYNGYSWLTTFSWNCTLYQAAFSDGPGTQGNMHKAEYTKETTNVSPYSVDCREMGLDNIAKYVAFFRDNEFRLAVRHATGKELSADNTFNVKTPINGVTEVYRYYRDIVNDPTLEGDPEVTEGD